MISRTGFSLVEVVVALVVFEVGVLGTLAMTLQAQKTLLGQVRSDKLQTHGKPLIEATGDRHTG